MIWPLSVVDGHGPQRWPQAPRWRNEREARRAFFIAEDLVEVVAAADRHESRSRNGGHAKVAFQGGETFDRVAVPPIKSPLVRTPSCGFLLTNLPQRGFFGIPSRHEKKRAIEGPLSPVASDRQRAQGE